MNILNHTVNELKDPTGILTGDRYEVIMNIELPEEDELFTSHGLYIKAIFVRDENGSRIPQYQLMESGTEKFLDFALEEEEESMVIAYCEENIGLK